MDLASFLGFLREWDQFQDIPCLTLTFNPYAQGGIQEQATQCILPQRLKMNLLGSQPHKN